MSICGWLVAGRFALHWRLLTNVARGAVPQAGGRTRVDSSEVFVGMDVSKDRRAVAAADSGRDGEVRFYREIGSDGASVCRFVRRLEQSGARLRFRYEADPTGYGLQRLIEGMGHESAVIAPSLIPRRPGERVKTNRRDAVTLVHLFRAGEFNEIWTPDETHEAMRDLVRVREAAVKSRTAPASARRFARSCCDTGRSTRVSRRGAEISSSGATTSLSTGPPTRSCCTKRSCQRRSAASGWHGWIRRSKTPSSNGRSASRTFSRAQNWL